MCDNCEKHLISGKSITENNIGIHEKIELTYISVI